MMPNVRKPDLPEWVTSEEDRLKTFKYWAYKSGPCNPQKMAEAGFYTNGKKSGSEWAVCYVCYKELDGWEKEDDPWEEHKNHSPNCLFIKIGKIPSRLTVEDIIRLEVERMKNLIKKKYEEDKKKLLEERDAVTELVNSISVTENKKPKRTSSRRK